MVGPTLQLLSRCLLATVVAAALDLFSAAMAAESLFSPPGLTPSEEANSSPWPAPAVATAVDDFIDSKAPAIGDSSEPAIELDLTGDDAVPTKNKRAAGGGFGGPFGGGSPLGYRMFGEPPVDVDGQATTFAHAGQELNGAYPVWTSEPHLLVLSTSIANDLFDTAARFPRDGLEFPEQLWNLRLGANYIRTLENDWKLLTGISVGSASDQPFAALRDVNPAVFSFLRIPRESENAWNVGVFYSPLSELPFPVPTVSYYWYHSDELQMNIGLPAQLTWRPIESFTFTGSYMLLHTISARGRWEFNELWSAYLAYENRNRAWFVHDRDRDDQRLFAYDQAVLAGVTRTLFEKFEAELAAGYMFGRFYFLGDDYSDRNRDRIDIGAGLSAAARIGLAF